MGYWGGSKGVPPCPAAPRAERRTQLPWHNEKRLGTPLRLPPRLGDPPDRRHPVGTPPVSPPPLFMCPPPLNLCPPPPQARGIDVQQVSLVINYDLPTNRENYIHR